MARSPSLFSGNLGTPEFVLDVAVALAWLPALGGTRYTSGVLGRMSKATTGVPGFWPYAFADALAAAERAGQTTRQETDRFLAGFRALRIRIDPQASRRVWPHTLTLARVHTISVSDAAYLELALRLKLPLATTHARLVSAAAVAGVPIFTP